MGARNSQANNNFSTEVIINLLTTIKTFRQAVYSTIQTESGTWLAEFEAQSKELLDLFKQKQSDFKLASISVDVKNATGYTDLEVIIDDTYINKIQEGPSTLFKNHSLGSHKLILHAKKGNDLTSLSQIIEVVADKATVVTFTLP